MRISGRWCLGLWVILGWTSLLQAQTPPTLSIFSPANRVFVQGDSDSLVVRPFSGTQPFAYQWFKAGVAITGATGADLLFPVVSFGDAGRYSVRVSNVAGQVTSPEVTVTVIPATPLEITLQPRQVSVLAGQAASFDVGFTGSRPVAFQWLRNGAPVAGATTNPFTITATTAGHAGTYAVVLTNAANSVTSNGAALVVAAATAPTITLDPKGTVVREGQEVSLSVAAVGSPPLDYQWYRNGVPLPKFEIGTSRYLGNVRLSDAGDYHVVVTNGGGSATSRVATVTVNAIPPPPIASVFSQTGSSGGEIQLGPIYAYGSNINSVGSNPSFQWYRNGEAIVGATAGGYQRRSLQVADAGDYFVVTTNSFGATASTTGRIDVVQPVHPVRGTWLAAECLGDIAYFVFTSPARIERFNLATETWLPPLPLSRVPGAFAVGANALYVASGPIIYRYAPDGTAESIFSGAFASEVTGLTVSGDLLFAQYRANFDTSLSTLRVADGTRVSTANYFSDWGPAMAAGATQRRVFSVVPNRSTAVVASASHDATGVLEPRALTNSYNNHAPGPSRRIFLSPDENLVADDGGNTYRSADLSFVSGLGGRFDDLVFTPGNLPIVLKSGRLVAFDARLRPTGEASLGIPAARIFLHGGQIFGFEYPPNTPGAAIRQAKVALAQIAPPPLAPAVDPTDVAFIPNAIFVDREGTVHLYSKLHRQLFRWSPDQRRYLSSIPLRGWPDHVTYAAATHRVYFADSESRLHQIRLDAARPIEEPFAIAPQQVLGLAVAGEFLFLLNRPAGWEASFHVFAADGTLSSPYTNGNYSADFAWNAALRRLYFFRPSQSDLHYVEIGAKGDLLEHPDPSSRDKVVVVAQYPLRISPDGATVLTGAGKLFDARSLAPVASLANEIDDAAWSNGRLFTGRWTLAGAVVQRWGGSNFAPDRTQTVAGRFLRLFALSGGRLLLVTVRDGGTVLTLLDEELAELSTTATAPRTRLANLSTRAIAGGGERALIPGFVIAGPQPKRLLIRAAGPALSAFGVDGALADPLLTVLDQAGATVATNNDWDRADNLGDLIYVTTKVGAFAFPFGSRDAAALVTLSPGAYTVQARGANDSIGVALVEIYDAQDADNTSRLVNIAARAQVGAGADVLIPGIVVQGGAPRTLLLRAVGPGLSAFGVSGALGNPRLRLFRGDQIVAENDDWGLTPGAGATEIAAAAAAAGAFPLPTGSRDAALLVTLPPGAYTAQVSAADAGTGVAIVEVYEVNK